MRRLLMAVAGGLVTLSACSDQQDGVEASLEAQAKASTDTSATIAAAGGTKVALGLSEAQLLDADLIDSSGADLGDVDAVLRNRRGEVDRLLVEVETPDPDRYVEIPVEGLTTRADGDDTDILTTLTAADLDALPAMSPPSA